jgi:hypothetical protein
VAGQRARAAQRVERATILARGDLIEPAHLPVFGPAPSTALPAGAANGVTIMPGMTVTRPKKLIMTLSPPAATDAPPKCSGSA